MIKTTAAFKKVPHGHSNSILASARSRIVRIGRVVDLVALAPLGFRQIYQRRICSGQPVGLMRPVGRGWQSGQEKGTKPRRRGGASV
jgi:hypothetical protein